MWATRARGAGAGVDRLVALLLSQMSLTAHT
ncbi:hypothetical protein DAI22_08g086150 [Oryza sativa Japonica Group]|nr:hypothetical protein DAI22_08g086150 [Oryza sativa Japonica Group]